MRSPMFCLAITIPAANCRSPFRVRSAICRRFTTTSRRRGAAICSTTSTPLYPFGFGLSYTTFAFGPPRLEKKKIRRNGTTQVLVDVTNTGNVRGDEVVQMYIRDLVSSVTRPVKELKGFQKSRWNRAKPKRSRLKSRRSRWRFTTST